MTKRRDPLRKTLEPVLPLLEDLERAGVRFLVAGAVAGIYHGHVRKTKDVDLCVGSDVVVLDRILDALHARGYRSLDVVDAVEMARSTNARFMAERLVDCLVRPKALDFEAAWERREEYSVGGVVLHFVSIEDLIAMKDAARRPKDLQDLPALREVQRLRAIKAKHRAR